MGQTVCVCTFSCEHPLWMYMCVRMCVNVRMCVQYLVMVHLLKHPAFLLPLALCAALGCLMCSIDNIRTCVLLTVLLDSWPCF